MFEDRADVAEADEDYGRRRKAVYKKTKNVNQRNHG